MFAVHWPESKLASLARNMQEAGGGSTRPF